MTLKAPDFHDSDPSGLRTPLDRRTHIVELVASAGFMTVTDIAAATGVSDITIRRDLAVLEHEAAVRRTHGGAMLAGVPDGRPHDSFEPAFEARRRRNMVAKERIARAAAALISPGETVAIDVGTTALAFAKALGVRDDVKAVTNNLRAASLIADTHIEVYVPGGRVRRRELAIGGATTVAEIGRLWFDSAVIGLSGLAEDGLFDYSPEDTEVKRAYMRRAERTIVLADATKFGRRALARIADLEDCAVLVTDAMPPAELAAALVQAGVRVILAGEP